MRNLSAIGCRYWIRSSSFSPDRSSRLFRANIISTGLHMAYSAALSPLRYRMVVLATCRSFNISAFFGKEARHHNVHSKYLLFPRSYIYCISPSATKAQQIRDQKTSDLLFGIIGSIVLEMLKIKFSVADLHQTTWGQVTGLILVDSDRTAL